MNNHIGKGHHEVRLCGCEVEQIRKEERERAQRIIESVTNNICEGCRGEGTWLAECCDGSRNCPCNGQPYFPGSCDSCKGTGLKDITEWKQEALKKLNTDS